MRKLEYVVIVWLAVVMVGVMCLALVVGFLVHPATLLLTTPILLLLILCLVDVWRDRGLWWD